MKTILKIVALVLLFAPSTYAQNPLVASQGPVLEAGFGYSYIQAGVPSQNNKLGMNGVDLLGTADFSPRFGIHLDLGYARNFDAYSSNHTADLFTYMVGPVFYPIRKRNLNLYTHLLLGGARERGVNLEPNGQIILGFANRFAWDVGAGAQYRFSRSWAARIGVDYLHTQFFDPRVQLAGQSNFKPSVALIYTFSEGREK
jgi:Outer membrane protein beta-barrel domain